MTYATNGNGPGGGGGVNINSRQALGPRNSLDYWNKSQDWQGVTTYYRTPTGPRSPYGMENIYAQAPPPRNLQQQRPAPFPLNLPITKVETRRLPQTRSPSAPEQGTYQNVPVGSRARKPSPPKDSPIFSAKVQSPSDSPIWSATSHPAQLHRENGHHGSHLHHNNHVAPISNSPQITRVEVRPSSVGAADKHRPPRSKPKWGRFMRTLCCCMRPEEKTEKSFAPPPNSSLPITQVQKGAYPEAVPPNYHPHQQPQQRPIPAQLPELNKSNDYSPAPLTIPQQPSPLSKTNEFRLLPQLRPADAHKKCLIIDLDETLVHSSFKPVKNADFVIPVEIDGVEHKVYVLKRPYVDEFLERVGERFECVLFTASLAKYADPVADLLDRRGVFRARLFREACVYHKGNYVKDLARLGRDLNKVIIIDNSPASYAFHPENAIPVQTWFDDPTDCELLEIVPLLERMDQLESVYHATRSSESPTNVILDRS